MKTVKAPISDSYNEYLIDYLRQNPQLAAAYLTTTLEEENPEPELLQQAINQVYQALAESEKYDQENLLTLSDVRGIYQFIHLLQTMGFKINISVTSDQLS